MIDELIEWLKTNKIEYKEVDIEPIPEALKDAWQEITTLTINHSYPLPADEQAKRQTAMQEVQTQVRSHKSYIEEFSIKEKAENEWKQILEEAAELDELSSGAMLQLAEQEAQQLGNEETEDEEEKPEETGKEKQGEQEPESGEN